jgi:hypothetical protein
VKYVALQTLEEQAKQKPIGYLQECLAAGKQDGELVLFEDEAFAELVAKFGRYRQSEADPYRERISGCCDRADQY